MCPKQQVFTLPNLLSFLRLLMIPLILWLYCGKQADGLALLVLMLSALTDVADGIIARKWNLISDLGKALDPAADKLTLIATMGCLLSRFSYMWLPLGVLVVKKSGQVKGADWHGKLCTALLYGTLGLHILWSAIPKGLSILLLILCTGVMCLSGVLYWYRNYKQIRGYA